MIISTGVYASVAPTSFARTSSVVKETVKASIDVIVAPLRNTNDVREDENEVFCDGERRDPEDCLESNENNNSLNESWDDSISNDWDDDTWDDMNDVREDENEVFCDGERRDPEDCVKRQAKNTMQYRTVQESNKSNNSDDSDDLDDTNDVREDENEVFCDGERRDPEDCAEREEKNDSEDDLNSLDDSDDSDESENYEDWEESNDVREDENEVFCDGERRDAEDCAKRVAKQENQSTSNDNEQESDKEDEDKYEDKYEDEEDDD